MEPQAIRSAGMDLELLRAGVRLMALRALGDADAADEVAQETLVRALVALSDVTPDRVGAYVGGIARHVIADVGRARARITSLDAVPATSLHGSAPDALEVLCTASERQRVRHALDQLSADDRELLHLCYFEGHSPAEIAERSDVPAERIRQRKHRALARLREAFDTVAPPRHIAASRATRGDGSMDAATAEESGST